MVLKNARHTKELGQAITSRWLPPKTSLSVSDPTIICYTLSHLAPRKNQLREANGVHDYIKERTIKIGNHVVKTRKTVRMIAKEFGVSKSTVHKDLTERLPEISPELANQVKLILEYHKSIRHIRGGEATRKKYKLENQKKDDNTNRA